MKPSGDRWEQLPSTSPKALGGLQPLGYLGGKENTRGHEQSGRFLQYAHVSFPLQGTEEPKGEGLCWTLLSPTRRDWWGMWSSRTALDAMNIKWCGSRPLGQWRAHLMNLMAHKSLKPDEMHLQVLWEVVGAVANPLSIKVSEVVAVKFSLTGNGETPYLPIKRKKWRPKELQASQSHLCAQPDCGTNPAGNYAKALEK